MECLLCDPCDTRIGADGENLPNLATMRVPLVYSDSETDYYILKMKMETHKLRYHFVIHTYDGVYVLDERGVSGPRDERYIRPFFVSFVFDEDLSCVPDWSGDTIWYQIFPDRFFPSKPALQVDWQCRPVTDRDAYCGGDLDGIREKIPYLKSIGVNGVYLNPVFTAGSVHRYDTIDYRSVDRRLGGDEALVRLCDTLHENDMRIMLDGVFNHCSWKASEFQDVLQKGESSPYFDWFCVTNANALGDVNQLNSESNGHSPYNTFAFAPSMPKWNTANPAVMEHLIGAAEYWTKRCKIDAWRLDVPDEIHASFLRRFRRRMKALQPDVYIVGEIWSDPNRWLSEGLFDGVMNYPVYFAVRDFFALRQIDANEFCSRITRYLALTPESQQKGMFQFCSTHDVPRILWFADRDRNALLNCYQMTALLSGGLSIYYGDEVGVSGGFDPDNRRCMPWGVDEPQSLLKETFEWYHNYHDCRIEAICPDGNDVVEIAISGVQRKNIRLSR